MAHHYGFGGPVNNTNYRTSYTNNFLYTDGYGMPTGNLDSTGNRPIAVYGVGVDWHTGATYAAINYQGSGNVGSGIWSSSGGGFRMVVGHGAGTLGVGRNTNNGLRMIDSADNDNVQGGIVGSLQWGTAPAAPSMISAVSGPGGSVRVQFSGSGDTGGMPITGWVLAYADNPSFNNPSIIGSTGTSDLVLTPGVTYWFKAAGQNDVVNRLGRYGAWAAPISAFVYGTPSAPYSLSASQPSINAVALNWAAPSDNGGTAVTSYTVQIAQNPSFTGGWTAWEANATSATIGGIGGLVYFRVRANNSQGAGPWSSGVTVNMATQPGTPGAPSVTQTGPGAVSYSWVAPWNGGSNITGYAVQWSTTSNFSSGTTTLETGAGTSLSISGLPGQMVHFRVLAHNRYGDSGWSAAISKLMATAPSEPRTLTATQASTTSFTTTWVAPASDGGSPVTGYRLEYGLNGSFADAQTLEVGNVLSRSITGLTPGLTYYVRATALNGATAAGAAVQWTSGISVKLAVEIGDLDGWSSFGTLPGNTAPIVPGALRRGGVLTVPGKTGLIREIQATGTGSVTGGTVGIQRTLTGLKVGTTYRLEGSIAIVSPVTPNPNSYAFGVLNKVTGTSTSVTLGTPSTLPVYTFVATLETHVVRIIMTETTAFTAGWFEGLALYDFRLTEIPVASPLRLQDTVYEGPLSQHFTYACDSVGASWWVDREGVTKFRQARSQDRVVATFSDKRAPGNLEYVGAATSFDVRNVVNVLEVNNHGRNAATGDADDRTYYGQNPAAVAKWNPRAGKLDSTLRTDFVNRTNLVLNPVAGVNGTGYSTATGGPGAVVLSRVPSQTSPNSATAMRMQLSAAVTDWMEFIYNATPVVTSRAYTFSADVFSTVSRATRVGIQWWNASAPISTSWGGAITAPSHKWERRSVSATAPAGAVSAVLVVNLQGGGTTNMQFQTTALMLEEGTTLGEYFDGNTTPDYRLEEVRRNLAINPSFEAVGNIIETRRNLCEAPNAVTASMWSDRWFGPGGAGTHTVQYGDSPVGAHIRKQWTTAPSSNGNTGFHIRGTTAMRTAVTAGQPYVWSGWLRTNVSGKSDVRAKIDWFNAAGANGLGTLVGTSITLTPNTWTRISVTGVAPAGAVSAVLLLDVDSGTTWQVGNYLDGTGGLLELGTEVGPYFDGGHGYSGDFLNDWVGTPNASATYRLVNGVAGVTSSAFPYPNGYQSSQWWKTGTKSLALATRDSRVGTDNFVNITGLMPNLLPETVYTVAVTAKVTKAFTASKLILRYNIPGVGDTYSHHPGSGNAGDEVELKFTLSTVGMTSGPSFIRLMNEMTDAGNITYFDNITVTPVGLAGAYFSGDTNDTAALDFRWAYEPNNSESIESRKGASSLPTNTFGWTGTPHASTSVQRAQHVTLLVNEALDGHSGPQKTISTIRWNAQQNVAVAASLDVQDRIRVEFGDTVQDSRIIGIKHEITAERWIMTLELDGSPS